MGSACFPSQTREVFFDMLRQFPQMSVAVMRELARRLDATNAKLLAVTR